MEKSSFKFICVLSLCFVAISLNAQVIQDENGRPLLAIHYTDVQGSPFLADSWTKGNVKLADGETYNDMDLKYDQVTDQLIFKNSIGAAMAFLKPVNEFTLLSVGSAVIQPLLFRNGYKPVNGNTAKTFYQVLSDGETPLIKQSIKKVSETKPYGSATVIKTFEEIHTYFLVQQGTPVKIKKDRKSILEALKDYQKELQEFVKNNNLNFKSEGDLIMLLTYYNGLK
ncbi:MAG TPA: hypothetical protein VLZ28_05075 [Daejeonella sp.]|nr:hypothetical protein [Daejeonella sp.]